jgi:hypothetical protein
MQSEDSSSLPAHGRIACARCFGGSAVWNETERIEDGWHIVNNPMSWGATAPRFLLLGVSKGTTQVDAIAAKPHDDVPFVGFRPALTRALQTLGLMGAGDSVDTKISAGEPDWAFGSMVRCALGLPKRDEIERSGTVVQQLARMPVSESWIMHCASAFLGALPTRLSVVVLLSNDHRYVEACFAAIRRLRPRTKRINDVAYSDGSITWVHIIHVGGPGKNHVTAWFEGEGKQGAKRRAAQAAVQRALGTAAVSAGAAPEAITFPTPPRGACAHATYRTPRPALPVPCRTIPPAMPSS